jgi:two-component system, chemotaxis family, protein-glutamate methylesterase/glutaminase
MECRNVVVVGASAGGVKALEKLAAGLPENLPAALFVVLHTPATEKSKLPEILSRAGPLQAVRATDNAEIRCGQIYIAPPDRHMVVERGKVRVVFSPRENLFRPAIDPLFRSAAYTYGTGAVGILLSGTLDDGCNGLALIKEMGGLTVVQEPAEAEFPHLPFNAIRRVAVDHVLPAAKIGTLLSNEVTKHDAWEGMSMGTEPPTRRFEGVTCPECSGPVYEEEGRPLLFRCVAGHSYSPETMRIAHSKKMEDALWSAIANFEEHAALLRRLAQDTNGDVRDLEGEARENLAHASELRALLEKTAQRMFFDADPAAQVSSKQFNGTEYARRSAEETQMAQSKSASNTLTDHDEIRNWAEERGGQPACVRGTGGKGDIGMLRLEFPDQPGANDEKLEPIEWDEFFEKFDERNLALLVQETTASGETSNFNKLVSRETAAAATNSGKANGGGAKRTVQSRATKRPAAKSASASKTAKTTASSRSASARSGSTGKSAQAKRAPEGGKTRGAGR